MLRKGWQEQPGAQTMTTRKTQAPRGTMWRRGEAESPRIAQHLSHKMFLLAKTEEEVGANYSWHRLMKGSVPINQEKHTFLSLEEELTMGDSYLQMTMSRRNHFAFHRGWGHGFQGSFRRILGMRGTFLGYGCVCIILVG